MLIVTFTRSPNPISNDDVKSVCGLGLYIDKKFDFREHIHIIIKKSTIMQGFIVRNAKKIQKNTLKS